MSEQTSEQESVVVESVGIVTISENKSRAKAIEEVMRQAILKACEEGISIVDNPDEIKKRMLDAREKFKQDERAPVVEEKLVEVQAETE